jgi:uncharacterized phosphosugar-binding protein
MENYFEKYFSVATERLNMVARESGAAIAQAAEAIATAIQNDGMFYLYGSGHSALTAKDAAYRAGGLAPVLTIEDVADGDAERVEGLAQYILARYDLRAGSAIAIISNSGINPTPIEVAMLTKQLGLTVIVITSLSHSQSVASRHSSGKKLYELGDIVIDTHGFPGDAAVQLPQSQIKSGALSTVIGAAIVQAITVQTAALLFERGVKPPVWISANVPGGDENNNVLLEKYRPRMARYQMAVLPKFKPHR